jgi:hypothetical protein
MTHFYAADLDGVPLDSIEIDGSRFSETGTAITATDDYYKRTITWLTYLGDGRMCNAMVLRKRIARFLYGVNGADVPLSLAQNVSIAMQASPLQYIITIPSSANPASSYFQEAVNSGILSFPFQIGVVINIA